jgi:hypothetical protein
VCGRWVGGWWASGRRALALRRFKKEAVLAHMVRSPPTLLWWWVLGEWQLVGVVVGGCRWWVGGGSEWVVSGWWSWVVLMARLLLTPNDN